MRTPIRSRLLLLALLLPLSGLAQPQVFTVDPAASQVHITLGGTAHTTHGIFRVERGEVGFNPDTAQLSGTVVVAAASGDTNNDSRDTRMKDEILEAPRYGQISFSPHSYQGKLTARGDSSLQVQGTFTLHGTPHEITIPMQVHIQGKTSSVRAHFLVPYVDWGLKNPSKFILKVDKQVAVDLELAGSVAPGV